MTREEKKEKVNEIIELVISNLEMNELQSAPIQMTDIDYLREEVYDTSKVSAAQTNLKFSLIMIC